MRKILYLFIILCVHTTTFAQPFLAELRLFPFDFAPKGWAQCKGQLLSISQNQALFALLGTTYGGNGTTNFALPNIQGRMIVGAGQGPGLPDYSIGQTGGSATFTITLPEMITHNHNGAILNAAALNFKYYANNMVGDQNTPKANYFAQNSVEAFNPTANVVMGTTAEQCTTNSVGGAGQPVPNMMPYLVMNYSIALQGIFPSQTKSANIKKGGGSDPFIGEIVLFAGNFVPRGWAECNGSLMLISQNPALFSLLGTYYGGDGKKTFALPDLRGRVPVHVGQAPGFDNYDLGQEGGNALLNLAMQNIPIHNHVATFPLSVYNGMGDRVSPEGNYPAIIPLKPMEYSSSHTSELSTTGAKLTFSNTNVTGGTQQPIPIMQPYVGMKFIIATQGIFPPRE